MNDDDGESLFDEYPQNNVSSAALHYQPSAQERAQILAEYANPNNNWFVDDVVCDDNDDASIFDNVDDVSEWQHVEVPPDVPMVPPVVPAVLLGVGAAAPTTQCPLCWEISWETRHQSATNTAMMSKVQNLRALIFKYEQKLRGVFSDEFIFSSLLQLRQMLIERHLDTHRIDHTKWTVPIIERHYNVVNAHQHDAVRKYQRRLRQIGSTIDFINDNAMHTINPESGVVEFNAKAAAEMRQMTALEASLVKLLSSAIEVQQASVGSVAQQVLSVLRSIQCIDERANGDDATDFDEEAIVDLFKMGGL